MTGTTASNEFPVTPGAFDTSLDGAADAFVMRLNAAGAALSHSTFLGGTDIDGGVGIAVDGRGHAHVTGAIGSADFPTTFGAFDTTHNGYFDAFITKLDLGAACPSEPDNNGDDHELECPDDADGNGIDDEGERG